MSSLHPVGDADRFKTRIEKEKDVIKGLADKGLLEDWELDLIREKVFIVLNNHTIWKGLFFQSYEQATMVIKRFHPKLEFNKDGMSWVEKRNGKRFTIYEVKQYLRMDDVKFVHEK